MTVGHPSSMTEHNMAAGQQGRHALGGNARGCRLVVLTACRASLAGGSRKLHSPVASTAEHLAYLQALVVQSWYEILRIMEG